MVQFSEEEDYDEEEETAEEFGAGQSQMLIKLIDIPANDGEINTEKLDNWIDQLETYYTIYEYNNRQKINVATLKLTKHTLTWWKAYNNHYSITTMTWKKFKRAIRKQFYPVGFEDYEAKFQAMVLDLDLEDHELFMKFIGGLQVYICKELRLFKVEDFEEAIVMAIAIKSKNKKVDKKEDKKDSRKFEVGSSSSNNREQSSGKKQTNCEHCNKPSHSKETCYVIHPELREKEKRKEVTKKILKEH
ncbi:unnamed protein product [Prunus armeniaca]